MMLLWLLLVLFFSLCIMKWLKILECSLLFFREYFFFLEDIMRASLFLVFLKVLYNWLRLLVELLWCVSRLLEWQVFVSMILCLAWLFLSINLMFLCMSLLWQLLQFIGMKKFCSLCLEKQNRIILFLFVCMKVVCMVFLILWQVVFLLMSNCI